MVSNRLPRREGPPLSPHGQESRWHVRARALHAVTRCPRAPWFGRAMATITRSVVSGTRGRQLRPVDRRRPLLTSGLARYSSASPWCLCLRPLKRGGPVLRWFESSWFVSSRPFEQCESNRPAAVLAPHHHRSCRASYKTASQTSALKLARCPALLPGVPLRRNPRCRSSPTRRPPAAAFPLGAPPLRRVRATSRPTRSGRVEVP
jgi:hypothetical protein